MTTREQVPSRGTRGCFLRNSYFTNELAVVWLVPAAAGRHNHPNDQLNRALREDHESVYLPEAAL